MTTLKGIPDEGIVIQQSPPLQGEVKISGAKNSALKLMVATTLAEGRFKLGNIPNIGDVATMSDLLCSIGSNVEKSGPKELTITTPAQLNPIVTYEQVEKMRASVLVLAPLLVRFSEAKVALPGGDNLGPRPVDMLLSALESLGAKTQVEHGYIHATAHQLIGAEIALDIPSVGATETAIMAGYGAQGTTTIENAAREPEVVDLANFLNTMAGNPNCIVGQGTSTITIIGTDIPSTCDITYEVIPDRIEAVTFLAALGIIGGDIVLNSVRPEDMSIPLHKFEEMGLELELGSGTIKASFKFGGIEKIRPADIPSLPYPGIPTDVLPLMVSMLCTADGDSVVTENLFDRRFGYTDELIRMGAYIRTEGQHAIIRGSKQLSGAQVKALDIRAGAALICAGLGAQGTTKITDIHHINRGYDDIVGKFQQLGANICVE